MKVGIRIQQVQVTGTMASMAAAGPASTTTADPASATTADPASSTAADPASSTAADPASTTAGDLDDFFTVNGADAVTEHPQSRMRQFRRLPRHQDFENRSRVR